MLPSVVASEVETALQDFLSTQFQPSNAALSGVIANFLSDRSNLLKGPYLSVSLPFERVSEGREPFPAIPLGFVPYRHQRIAFERLAAGHSTVIATGTGSGKTECFLYPILDWCREHAGERGIKAILIYPMNALATDQAGRIARIVHGSDALRGKVTAGIYIGQDGPSPHSRMTSTRIVSNRETLVEHPPDILLTNYKMLDYLLSRPKDQRLWRRNSPDALRWLVVDELHTFDGAQGTDLACLVRRLKARLGMTDVPLTCVGTSATLGDASEDALRAYVSEIFGSDFEPGSIVAETRQGIDEFLGDTLLRDHLMPGDGFSEALDPARFGSTADYIRAQYELFFGEAPGPDFLADAWRVELAERLCGHSAFVNLLRTLAGRPKALPQVMEEFRRSLSRCSDRELQGVLLGLCSLISVARTVDESGSLESLQPFLRVSFHLWARELRRMVCSVHEGMPPETSPPAVPASDGSPPGVSETAVGPVARAGDGDAKPIRRLLHADDLTPDNSSTFLPLVQCHQCRVTGWGAVLDSSGDRVRRDVRHFYNHFFARDIDVQFLFPEQPSSRTRGHPGSVCGACGYFRLEHVDGPCPECRADRIVKVFVPDAAIEESRGGEKRKVLSRHCPFCAARDSLFVFGARSSSLLSVALGQTYASRHNDDRKVIAFSDNVQDAAHRAGFLAHRTWRHGKRAAIAQVVMARDGLSLAELPGLVTAKWTDAFDPKRFVSEFIAPDRTWLREFKDFVKTGRLPSGSSLPDLVRRRLEWDALAEFGFDAATAHSLERARVAAAGPEIPAFEGACAAAAAQLREEIEGLRDIELEQVRWVALGLLRRMKACGAIFSADVEGVRRFLAGGCNLWSLTRDPALPEFGPNSPSPLFPAEEGARRKDARVEPLSLPGGRSWYQRWIDRTLGSRFPLVSTYHAPSILRILLESLRAKGLTKFHLAKDIPIWAIDPQRFLVTTDLRVLRCASPARALVVPRDEAPLWLGAPSLELGVSDSYQRLAAEPPTWAGRTYRQARIRRVVAEEHTALLTREWRERIQTRFASEDPRPWDPNMLSATPTLELGIDIGDLSTVALCSVPPGQANYLQRIGRAGRRDGNAFTVTLAAAESHDSFFFAEPLAMLAGAVTPPGVFLNASSVLERQLTAFCLDNWAAACHDPDAVPHLIRNVLDDVQNTSLGVFPYTFFDFTKKHAKRLLSRFFQAFEGSLTEETQAHLRAFLRGAPGRPTSLERRILERLEQSVKERRSIRRDADKLRARIRKLKGQPQDEATAAEIKAREREGRGLRKLLANLNGRNTFAYLTDEGLIPNYSFPEEGVTLRSVILRRPAVAEADQATPGSKQGHQDQDLEVYEYLRPAASALSELAPFNRFYAGGHRVEIDRVDLNVSSIETWRLCPSCTHCRCIDGGDEYLNCPRCGDPMWADTAQVRQMLPLKLVHATTPARRAQIMDDRDDRESFFFNRHLVADFEAGPERRAYAVPPPGVPFAFEYVAKTTFREMNFGRLSSKGQLTRFAGQELPRDGFRICRFCGKVQSRRGSAAGESEHTLGCNRALRVQYAALPDSADFGDADGSRPGDSAMIDCLYLYREFNSESLRMLIPVVEEEGDGPRVQSFIAAVELGLREKFRGQIDHIRVMTSESPGPERNQRRNHLIFYDTVPGGTGYLKQLAAAPAELVEVFRMALARLQGCQCEDGCYRCVFAYRRSRELKRTSRRLATRLLDEVLAHADRLERIESLDGVKLEGLLESNLEARFVRALEQRAASERGLRITPEIVRGKAGYVLKLDSETWYVEPQAELNRGEGVAEASRPDFLLHPAKPSPNKRAVAIFLDGFQYHKHSTGDDSIKRLALLRSGYLQWSLTWRDLEVAFGGTADAPDFLAGQPGADGSVNQMKALQEKLDAKWSSGPLRARLRESSFDLLLRYLAEPDLERWKRAVFTEVFRIFERSRMADAGFQATFRAAAREVLPPQAADVLLNSDGALFVAGRGRFLDPDCAAVDLFVALPSEAVARGDADRMFVAAHLHDRDPEAAGYRNAWNGALRLFNLVQFLPQAWWTTSLGASRGRYPEFEPAAELGTALGAAWQEAIESADPEVGGLLRDLARSGAPAPEVGYDLEDAAGIIVGEAELAWENARVAVLRTDQAVHAAAFEAGGWRTWNSAAQAAVVQAALEDRAAKEV